MKFNYQANSKFSGIYKILNTHTNRVYIGQAKSFQQRWYDHKRSLLNDKHQNKFLLNDFRKCSEELGHDDFLEFHVLEVMEDSTKKERNKREEEWIAKFWDGQQTCYNFKEKTEAQERSCYSLTPEETRKKIAQNSQKMWDAMSDAEKLNRMEPTLKARREKKLEIAQKVSEANSKKSINAINLLTGQRTYFRSASEAGRVLKIHSSNIRCVLSKKHTQAKGYSFEYLDT